jgi:hypothetical protein
MRAYDVNHRYQYSTTSAICKACPTHFGHHAKNGMFYHVDQRVTAECALHDKGTSGLIAAAAVRLSGPIVTLTSGFVKLPGAGIAANASAWLPTSMIAFDRCRRLPAATLSPANIERQERPISGAFRAHFGNSVGTLFTHAKAPDRY